MKEKFIEIYKEYIMRDGADKLLAYLEKSDFFDAPASTKYHGSEPGGLCKHSINVFHRLMLECLTESNPASYETRAICGLLHDICKVNYYKPDTRNVKVDGKWEQVPYYSVEEKFTYGGHGSKSVFLIERFMRLTEEEAIAIHNHMGAFDIRPGDYSLSNIFTTYPLAFLLHVADMKATYMDESTQN